MLPAFLRYMTLVIALPLNDYKRERERVTLADEYKDRR
jgi:hypothetical protein